MEKIYSVEGHTLLGFKPQRANNKLVTVSVRVKEAKYPHAIVLPLWSHSQLLHCRSGLQKRKDIEGKAETDL